MKKLDVIAEQLFNQIRSRFPSVEIGDAEGNVTTEPSMARFYEFDYEDGGNNLGKISISLDETDGVVIMYSQNFLENEYTSVKSTWFNFLKEIRSFAKKRLMKFEVRDITKSNLTKRDYKFLATNRPGDQTMAESKMYGTNKTSYQKIGNARIAIKHKSAINVENANNRTKQIGSIFIESPSGEKFKFPFKHLSGARAMARHVSEGGNAYDDFGKYISGLSEELSKLTKFKQYMNRSSVMAESLAGYMDTVNERITDVRKTVQNLQKESFYKTSFESYKAPETKEVPDDIAENWIDQLTIKQFNEELKDVFPYIYNLVSEATKAKELSFEDIMMDDMQEQYLNANPGETIADLVVRAQRELGIETTADDIIEVNGLDDNPRFTKPTQILIPNPTGSSAPTRSVRPQARPVQIGAGGTSELAPNGQPTGSTRGIDPALNYNEAIDKAFEQMMGQFSESDKGDMDRDGKDEPDDKEWRDARHAAIAKAMGAGDEETTESKIPLGEFILSYFDRETGQFPKGPTAVLTMVEKEYGEQYVRPASKFIERIDAKVAEVMGYRDTDLGEENSELDMVDFDDREHRLEQFLKRVPDGNGNVWSLAGKKFFYAPGNREAAIKRALTITDRGYDYTQIDHMLIGPINTDSYKNNEENIGEGFLSNLVGDVRNAFKPGVAVTPNMIKELEAGLAAIKAGGQPTPRQQQTMDRFMSDTLAKSTNTRISKTLNRNGQTARI
jgi:hypothetical protein